MKNMMIGALMAVAAISLQANTEIAKSDCHGCSSSAALSTEEQAFASKLSAAQSKAFHMMNQEQRNAVMTAAVDPAVTPDAAVEKMVQEHHVSMSQAPVTKVEKK